MKLSIKDLLPKRFGSSHCYLHKTLVYDNSDDYAWAFMIRSTPPTEKDGVKTVTVSLFEPIVRPEADKVMNFIRLCFDGKPLENVKLSIVYTNPVGINVFKDEFTNCKCINADFGEVSYDDKGIPNSPDIVLTISYDKVARIDIEK